MGAPSEKQVSDQESPGETAVISEKYADVTLRIVEEHGKDFGPLTPEKEKKLQWKLYLHVMGLLSAINLLLFVRLRTNISYHLLTGYRLTNQLSAMPPFWDCLKRLA